MWTYQEKEKEGNQRAFQKIYEDILKTSFWWWLKSMNFILLDSTNQMKWKEEPIKYKKNVLKGLTNRTVSYCL